MICLSVRQWPGRPGFNPRSSHTKDSKNGTWCPLLNTQHYKVRIKGKVEQSREGVAPSPTHWCSSYRKGSLRVTLDYGRQLYFTYRYILCSCKETPQTWLNCHYEFIQPENIIIVPVSSDMYHHLIRYVTIAIYRTLPQIHMIFLMYTIRQ